MVLENTPFPGFAWPIDTPSSHLIPLRPHAFLFQSAHSHPKRSTECSELMLSVVVEFKS